MRSTRQKPPSHPARRCSPWWVALRVMRRFPTAPLWRQLAVHARARAGSATGPSRVGRAV